MQKGVVRTVIASGGSDPKKAIGLCRFGHPVRCTGTETIRVLSLCWCLGMLDACVVSYDSMHNAGW